MPESPDFNLEPWIADSLVLAIHLPIIDLDLDSSQSPASIENAIKESLADFVAEYCIVSGPDFLPEEFLCPESWDDPIITGTEKHMLDFTVGAYLLRALEVTLSKTDLPPEAVEIEMARQIEDIIFSIYSPIDPILIQELKGN